MLQNLVGTGICSRIRSGFRIHTAVHYDIGILIFVLLKPETALFIIIIGYISCRNDDSCRVYLGALRKHRSVRVDEDKCTNRVDCTCNLRQLSSRYTV